AKFLINNNILALGSVRHFAACCQQTLGNHVRCILASATQTGFERFNGWGQDENAYRLREVPSNLSRALPVNFEKHIAALLDEGFNSIAGRAVKVAVYFGPFKQAAIVAQLHELFYGYETVVFIGLFAATRGAGGA